MIDKNRLIKLTQELIRINSENPGSDEYKISRFIKHYLERMGLGSEIYEFKRRRSNVIARIAGKDKKYSLLLSPHLDTVPAGSNWRFNPFGGIICKGRIYGRGATDDKGNLACALEVLNSIVEDRIKLDYNLLFAATADEESGSKYGLIPLINKSMLKPDYALILDTVNFHIVIAQKGLLHIRVRLQGKKAHGAYPWQGENAIDKAVQILKEIKRYRFRYKPHPFLRAPTINIGTIQGGDKVNIVADWCEFQLDIRFLRGMIVKDILVNIKKIIKKYIHKFNIEIQCIQKPYAINKRDPLINYLIKAVKNLNLKPQLTGSEGATVMTFFQDKKIPAVAFGFGSSGQSHNTDEYVKINNLYKGARALEEFLKIFNPYP